MKNPAKRQLETRQTVRAYLKIHGLNLRAILPRFQAIISEKYATILKKFCEGRWAKE
jgi:hypothetical protein